MRILELKEYYQCDISSPNSSLGTHGLGRDGMMGDCDAGNCWGNACYTHISNDLIHGLFCKKEQH